jgi:hypothetical protein
LLGLSIWIADNFFINHISDNNSLFRVSYSFVIVFFSIDLFNRVLIFDSGPVLKNALFLIAISFLVYYGLKAFVESFNVFHLGLSTELLKILWKILYFVNVFTNLLFTTAILCMPTRRKFTMVY